MPPITKTLINAIVLVAATVSIAAGLSPAMETFAKGRVYDCDFRLISPATCNLPMAANTTRVTVTSAEADRAKRVARRDRIIACEREQTIQRQNGETEPKAKCWDSTSR